MIATLPSLIGIGAPSSNDAATKKIDGVSKEFESIFLTEMLQTMFSGDSLGSFFGEGTAGDVYKGYMLDALGKSITNAGGIGIASSVKQELLKLQEMQS